jgi:glutamine synthetase
LRKARRRNDAQRQARSWRDVAAADSAPRRRSQPHVAFAFTGNKFEFRAVGSSATAAWPNTVMNTIVAESLDYLATELEKAVGSKADEAKLKSAVSSILKKLIKEHKRIIFNGDGYSEAWHKEAAKRGLPNLKDSVEAYPALQAKEASCCSRSTACSRSRNWRAASTSF